MEAKTILFPAAFKDIFTPASLISFIFSSAPYFFNLKKFPPNVLVKIMSEPASI